MLDALDTFALEVRHLERATAFYETHLGLADARADKREAGSESTHQTSESTHQTSEDDHQAVYEVGDTALVLREPSTVPRGGLHAHYAFSTTEDAYGDWHDRLASDFDLAEFDFGAARSLYFDDPDGHCVEIGTGGQRAESSTNGGLPLTGVFEVVLEVEALDPAVAFYESLGFDIVDRGDDRQRVRLDGPVDLELWEPQLGIADARGAVHADLSFLASDPAATAEAVAERACDVTLLGDGVRVRDPDGHYLTFRPN